LIYGVKFWGWKEREKIKRVEERYLRWVLGVEARTQGYLIRNELQRDKLEGPGIEHGGLKKDWRKEGETS